MGVNNSKFKIYNMQTTPTNGGRKQGSFNKLTPTAKENLLQLFGEDIQRLHKSLNYISPEDKFVKLRPILQLLCKGDDEVSKKTREIIFESLKDEFKKLPTYLRQLPADKRAIELKKIIFLLDKESIESIFSSMK